MWIPRVYINNSGPLICGSHPTLGIRWGVQLHLCKFCSQPGWVDLGNMSDELWDVETVRRSQFLGSDGLHHSADWLSISICEPVRKNTESGAAAFYCWVVGPLFFMALTVLYVHYAEDHLPKSNGRENKYITLHLSDLSLSGFYDVIRT